jgi:hypothetical protein
LNSKSVEENIWKTVVKVEIGTFWVVILTPTAGDGLMVNYQIFITLSLFLEPILDFGHFLNNLNASKCNKAQNYYYYYMNKDLFL